MFVDSLKLLEFMQDNPNHDKLPSLAEIGKADRRGDYSLTKVLADARAREIYTSVYGYAVITKELISDIKAQVGDAHVLELGSGSGWLAKFLEEAGVDIMTVDTDDWGFEIQHRKTDLVSSYRQLDISAYDTFILAWPNYGSSAASELVSTMKTGDKLLYCGEDGGGCTGDEQLEDDLCGKWVVDTDAFSSSIRFTGIHDYWRTYVKL